MFSNSIFSLTIRLIFLISILVKSLEADLQNDLLLFIIG